MNIDGGLDHLNSDFSDNAKFSYSVQASNSYEIGSVFQCPVWVDLGENNIADIASILLAKGLDSGIPIEIKIRMSLNCLYIPLTIFAISVFLAVIFLGVLCFYTKTRTFKGIFPSRNNNNNTNNNLNGITINAAPKPKPLPKISKSLMPATNFLVYDTIDKLNGGKVDGSRIYSSKVDGGKNNDRNITETTSASHPKVPIRKKTRKVESKRERRVNKAMGELMEEDYAQTFYSDFRENREVVQIQNPTIVRHQVSGAAALCGNQADPISFI